MTSKTDNKQPRRPRRNISGVLLLDKPLGISSNNALQQVKWIYQAKKAGHTGSLDPLASGLLPICLGEATKVSAYLLDADKHYQVECQLGSRTATGDTEGEVLETAPVPALSKKQINTVLTTFHGAISQIPPMYSALKHQGRRLYELARKGEEVERKPRELHISELSLLAQHGDKLRLDVRCSKGTYIRTLVEDIAVALGTVAHVTVLRRLGTGPYDEEQPMHTLASLRALEEAGDLASLDDLLLPIDSAIQHWPEARLADDSAWYLQRGQSVLVPGAP
ncbi:MAG TPA: tRNA pseudouridine(55) synthase TruB, partial [Gammaproteobacteria bacterium]|nr:tRNA pseudouridine(55) synthase TruB [Gammaproteobacteria bacterium]